MTLLLKVACPECGTVCNSAALGAELRCSRCGLDFRAIGDGENASRVVSVTPDEMDHVPYSQRTIEIPVNSVSSVMMADPAVLNDRLLRDAPLKENARWVGKVRLLKRLGQGGMSTVYRGFDESLLLDVAVKILPVPMGERDGQFVERFRQEAHISARINHPNVVRTLHVDEEGDLIYLVMDYVEGQTARNLVDQKGPLGLPRALQIIHDATRGMEAAHTHGVIHRDIKPENILVADDGRVLLSDLGLAKAVSGSKSARLPVTRMGLVLGTPEYMSPEQWEIGGTVTPAADIWSMGATLWMLLTKHAPYSDADMAVLARQIKDAPLPDILKIRPELPLTVVELLARCLAKNPGDRFASAGELLVAIDAVLNNQPLPAALAPRRAPADAQALALPSPAPASAPMAPPSPAYAPDLKALPPKTNPRKPIIAIAAGGVLAVAILVLAYQSLAVKTVTPVPVLDVSAPASVKPGEEAELSVALNDVPDPAAFTVCWIRGESKYFKNTIHMALKNDAEFELVCRSRASGQEVARRTVKVLVELQVHAAEKDFYQAEAGTQLQFEGQVIGGGGKAGLEYRWIDSRDPDKVLSKDLLLDLSRIDAVEPGRRTFVLEVKRREKPNWLSAVSDKVTVEITRRIPPEFIAHMREGTQARENAARADHGADVTVQWQKAIAAFEKALEVMPDDQAREQADACRQRLDLEEKYVAMLNEARRLKKDAEATAESDGILALSAWSETLRSFSAAAALFDRAEVRVEIAGVEARLSALRTKLGMAEQERNSYDTVLAKARHSAREARKYLSPSVALPHWEGALNGFMDAKKRFAKKADEFALELQEAQENYDKSYLYDKFGIVPLAENEAGPEPAKAAKQIPKALIIPPAGPAMTPKRPETKP